MMGGNLDPRADPRTLVPPYLRAAPPDDVPPPPDDALARPTDEDEPSAFPTLLLALGVAIGLAGAVRLGWNVAEEAYLDYGVWVVLDRCLGYFTCFSNFVIAAGVWRLIRRPS